VHGDPDAAEAFARRIRSELHMNAHVPKHRETVSLV
jgi:predicted metal-dependent RNase